MCLGIPGRIVGFDSQTPRLATIDVAGVSRAVDTSLLDGLQIGDWVVVHVGFALTKIDAAEADAALNMLGVTETESS